MLNFSLGCSSPLITITSGFELLPCSLSTLTLFSSSNLDSQSHVGMSLQNTITGIPAWSSRFTLSIILAAKIKNTVHWEYHHRNTSLVIMLYHLNISGCKDCKQNKSLILHILVQIKVTTCHSLMGFTFSFSKNCSLYHLSLAVMSKHISLDAISNSWVNVIHEYVFTTTAKSH